MHWSFLNKSPTVNNKQMNHSWLPASDTDSIFFSLWLNKYYMIYAWLDHVSK